MKYIAVLLIFCSCATTQTLTKTQQAQQHGNKWITRNATNTKQFKWWSLALIIVLGVGVEKHESSKR